MGVCVRKSPTDREATVGVRKELKRDEAVLGQFLQTLCAIGDKSLR